MKLALKGLSRAQRLVLVRVLELGLEGLTMSSLASRLEESGVPLTTAKWSLRKLRSFGLLRCGDAKRRGLPSRLTPLGRALAKAVGDVRRGDRDVT